MFVPTTRMSILKLKQFVICGLHHNLKERGSLYLTPQLLFSRAMALATDSIASIKPQQFDFFLVLDFEATCEKNKKIRPQEIIEFPVLKVNGKTFEVEAEFHQYVQPQIHQELTTFCTELTGIVQDMVDGQPHIDETLKKFDCWLQDQGLQDGVTKFAFVTCGDWDLKTMLPHQAQVFKLQYPGCMKRWINIKSPYAEAMGGRYPKGMMGMLSGLSLSHQGRHHSGIDDCRNIANILKALAERGSVFSITASLM